MWGACRALCTVGSIRYMYLDNLIVVSSSPNVLIDEDTDIRNMTWSCRPWCLTSCREFWRRSSSHPRAMARSPSQFTISASLQRERNHRPRFPSWGPLFHFTSALRSTLLKLVGLTIHYTFKYTNRLPTDIKPGLCPWFFHTTNISNDALDRDKEVVHSVTSNKHSRIPNSSLLAWCLCLKHVWTISLSSSHCTGCQEDPF